ncbi:hypothetical protein WR25_15291 [Diploscapter pachys]|uniref:Carboxylesterase type B domain-containing protein n=1 Tax=Diploscapter pachys TaxID=2018661 RepID=A0A2A2KFM8_9BILA|nr:hypothetical protein WR25_15291 [Diploscapter pachys]
MDSRVERTHGCVDHGKEKRIPKKEGEIENDERQRQEEKEMLLQKRAACLQNASSTTPPPEYMDEDCLFLHIYTSDRCLESSSKCPVIFYLYGGDFIKGSPVQYPDSFIVDHYASQDIIAALEYLQTEIFNFGGNPLDVVMMGHSSGAAFVANAVMSKRFDPDKRLFQRGIVLSGINAFMNASDIMANSWEFVRRIGVN